MVYSQDELKGGEEIVLDLRPHWWFFSSQFFAVVVTLLFALAIGFVWDPQNVAIELIGVTPFVLAVLAFGLRYVQWITTNFVLTTDRLINRSGVLKRQGIEIPLERVNTVFFSQTIFERLIGSGDLVIESAGEQGRQLFTDIKKPLVVQNEIHQQMEHNENRKFDRAAGQAPASIPEQIDHLDELRMRGVITQDEFEASKQELLGRL